VRLRLAHNLRGQRPFLTRPSTQLVFDGQSYNHAPFDGPRTFPNQLVYELLPVGEFYHRVTAISNSSYTQRESTVAARVDATLRQAVKSVFIDTAGGSDLHTEGKTAAQLLALVEANADARRAAGADVVIVLTIMKSIWFVGAGETVRQQYNALLLANAHGKFDAVVNVASASQFQDYTNMTYYQLDQLHPTVAGCTIYAQYVYDALEELGLI
jgi:lysophospholipase L1-like esterase